MNVYSVYHIHAGTRHDDGYIGITKNPELRFQQHGWKRKKCNAHLRNALSKYKDRVVFDVLASNLDFEAACLLEEMLRPNPNMGWNVAAGGNVPPNPKGKARTEEHCKNISAAKLGEKNPMFGKKLTFSEEHRKNISLATAGRPSPLKGSKRPTLVCPHCGVTGAVGAMGRWHFDRCKNASV